MFPNSNAINNDKLVYGFVMSVPNTKTKKKKKLQIIDENMHHRELKSSDLRNFQNGTLEKNIVICPVFCFEFSSLIVNKRERQSSLASFIKREIFSCLGSI